MTTQLDICNMALRHIASTGGQIANLATERSKEAQACRLFYPQVRDEVLRDFPWPFATRITPLALVEEDPTSEWLFAYRYPANCASFRRLLTPSSLAMSFFNAPVVRYPMRNARLRFRISRDDVGKLIYSNEDAPYGEWTEQLDNPEDYSADFVAAVSWKLAAYIAPSVAGGDQFKLGDRALQVYMSMIARAKQNAANEENQELEPGGSELEDSRG